MQRFKAAQRVKVTDIDSPLLGKTGTVYLRLVRDDSAWLTMDEPIPAAMARFPDGDPRRDNVIFYPEQCEPY